MAPADSISGPTNGYLELAPPQLLADQWRELNFDLASGHNVLQELVMPESGGGYVYREAHTIGSATQNRFLYWRTANDILELIDISTEAELDDNQVRIRFVNCPIINEVTVIEFSESVVIMLATLNSVHKFHLSHPKATNKSILHDLNTDTLFDPSNYYILSNHSSFNNEHPICSTSWYDRGLLKCALSLPDSSLVIVQFAKNSHHISTSEIKQIGIIGRLWSRMPNILTRNPNDCVNSVFMCSPYHHHQTNDILLFTLCKDWKIRIFSTNSRECVYTHPILPQIALSQSISSYANPTTEQPIMKLFGSRIVLYLTEDKPEFVIYSYLYQDDTHLLKEESIISTPTWEKLIDFSMSKHKMWALANVHETESVLCYVDLENTIDRTDQDDDEIEAVWDYVNLVDDFEIPAVKNYVSEIFWSNHFSVATVAKAFNLCLGSNSAVSKDIVPKMHLLEEAAFTGIVDSDQDEAWKRFYNYCLQNHHAANKNIGLVMAGDESLISIVKRSNPSYICPWPVSMEMVVQGGPYRGIEFSPLIHKGLVDSLNYISSDLIDDELAKSFEISTFEKPADTLRYIDEMTRAMVNSKSVTLSNFNIGSKNFILSSIEAICEQLDLTREATEFAFKLMKQSSTTLRSKHNPLESNSGIILTFELFKRIVRARMVLARDLLIYIHLINVLSESKKVTPTENFLRNLCHDLYKSAKVKRIADSLRAYAVLVWITETPIKTYTTKNKTEAIEQVATNFRFFKSASSAYENSTDSSLDLVIYQNLLMNFLINGGINHTSCIEDVSTLPHTISNSLYVTKIANNLCMLLWPKTEFLCFPEFLFTRQLDSHLSKYLDLTDNWLSQSEYDRHFIRAANCILQNRATEAVNIFSSLWMNMNPSNLLGRFIGLDKEESGLKDGEKLSINPTLIYRYYDRLIQLFQVNNNHQSLIILINHCMSLLDGSSDPEQQHWVNCFRAKLFQYHLELEDSDEAYHTMVLTTDPSLRINCLRKFIVSHCEKEQWSNLLSYPFIDIKNDFIDILNQKAESSDLSKLNGKDFYKTSYYDLLFASYVSDDEFRRAAEVMYNYAQRLAHEVPGIVSIKKQADCLLVALNSLKCVDRKEAFIESGAINQKDEGRTSVLKRAHDCESESSSNTRLGNNQSILMMSSRIGCKEIEMKYELTRARLKLLERDQTAYAIALSPLKPEETIAQLVAASMFSAAMDLALLFKSSIEPILEGLTAKFIFIMRLSTVDIVMHQDLDRRLSDIFTSSYSNIDTYNYIANSTCSLAEKLWRFIDYYLSTYDGISHRYSTDTFSGTFAGTTVLMRVVAYKLLSAGCDIPASLMRLYMIRNTAELLKLLIKFDKLEAAAEFANEIMDRVLEPSFTFTKPFQSSDPPPLYLPTHLILLLITYLNEDATNTCYVKTGEALMDKLNKFRRSVKSS